MYKKLFISLGLFLLIACAQQKEEAKEPSVLKFAPSALNDESWQAHSVGVKLVCDLDAEVSLQEADWVEIISKEVTGNGQTTITLQMEANEGDESRSGVLSAKCGSSTIECKISQHPLGSNYGIYHLSGSSSDLSFDELKHQTSVRRYPDGSVVSRLLCPSEEKYAIFRTLPSNPNKDDIVSFSLYQNWLEGVSAEKNFTMVVAKVEDNKLWLYTGETVMIVKI